MLIDGTLWQNLSYKKTNMFLNIQRQITKVYWEADMHVHMLKANAIYFFFHPTIVL